ncbi:hypothetical protein [Streptomyces iranensis]|uniref:hypothetical protein n=1 Tax=Streptomyces iranensis TaxID=576784 RepID=UPI0039B76C6C
MRTSLPRLRDGQKFLVTEFSLVQLWKLHLNDTIPARFARRYRLPYGVTQGAAMTRDFGPDKQPWLLNSLYANRTVERADDGSPAHNYGFFDDFRALQSPQS